MKPNLIELSPYPLITSTPSNRSVISYEEIRALMRIEAGSKPSLPGFRELNSQEWTLRIGIMKGIQSQLWVPEKESWNDLRLPQATVMEILMINAGKNVATDDIMEMLDNVSSRGTVGVRIAELRRVTEIDPTNPQHIITEGKNYRFQP